MSHDAIAALVISYVLGAVFTAMYVGSAGDAGLGHIWFAGLFAPLVWLRGLCRGALDWWHS